MKFTAADLKKSGFFSDIDIHLSEFLSAAGGEESPLFKLTVMMLSSRLNSGDVCLSLDDVAEKPLSYFFGEDSDDENNYRDILIPSKKEILSVLDKSKAVGVEGDYLPLILEDGNNLYFHKYNSFENLLAENIKRLAVNKSDAGDISDIKNTFSILFPSADGETDWQGVAAYSALSGGITVISGGPGTGKTSTVVKILALIVESGIKSGRDVSISLAAPTGKAAARLKDAVSSVLSGLPVGDDIKMSIPSETFTIHRLLGSLKDSHEFRHNKNNPLPHDVIVVDECSMGDMALMCRLLDALKPGAQVILLGDRNQLSSVEGGAVFGDLCGLMDDVYTKRFLDRGRSHLGINISVPEAENAEPGPMNDAQVVLKKSWRFGGKTGIGILAELVKNGDADGAVDILHDESYPDVYMTDGISIEAVSNSYRNIARSFISVLDYSGVPIEEKISKLINGISILTALRRGWSGIEGMNAMAENVLYNMGVIEPAGKFYPGRPVMISRNDYPLSLFNGDIGIVSGNNHADVVFSDGEGKTRSINPSRLPEHETAFAMTIHKSQGSEFDNVLVVMPDKWNMIMTRELLYTAVTRARCGVIIASGEDVLKDMILTPAKRMSGLRRKIWGATG